MAKWIIIIAVLIILIIYYANTVINSFVVKFTIDDLSLANLSLETLNKGTSFVRTRIKFIINFDSIFNIIFSNLKLNAYYKNKLVAKSSPNNLENAKRNVLIKNSNNIVYQTFDLQLNPEMLDVIYKIKTNQQYEISYTASLRLFGIPITYTDTYNSIN